MIGKFVCLLPLLFLLTCCSSEPRQEASLKQCTSCHQVDLDANHQFSCTDCHRGSNHAENKERAHELLIARPSHPDNMRNSCGACHEDIVEGLDSSAHYTLSNLTNQFRAAFGAKEPLGSFLETSQAPSPQTVSDLADDLLRRRCFRCHLFSQGDNYPSVRHGTGCAACHLSFYEGHATSHQFGRPGDKQCLSCHYGNYVGADYHGRFEHDFNREYRTPYTTYNDHFRPYGVEYHQLQADVHQKRGMECIDCHGGHELMSSGAPKPECRSCHLEAQPEGPFPPRVSAHNNTLVLTDAAGKKRPIPPMRNPAHGQYGETVACQACHAQWTFNDLGKHYLRSDTDNYDAWWALGVQGSFEVEQFIENNTDFDKPEMAIQMTDKISGTSHPGIWYKGYTQRRWEDVILGFDDNGIITPMRPILDHVLSWIDAEDVVRFDSVPARPHNGAWQPYVPHTTGSAGMFYHQRLSFILQSKANSVPTDPYMPKNQ